MTTVSSTALDKAARAAAWRAKANTALGMFEDSYTGNPVSVFALSFITQTLAWQRGWSDPAVADYLDQVYALQNPDGGYGLNRIYDAHGNGTNNPANTTYIVTITDHVGKTFLDGYRAGVVPFGRVKTFVDLIATCPRIDTTAGRGVAYSRNANDAKTGLLVHNVNAGAAAFLMEAAGVGFEIPWYLVQGIIKRSMSAYDAGTRYWPYRDNMAPASQDTDHNSFTAESMYLLAPAVGYSSAFKMMSTPPDGHPQTPIAYMRLTGLPPMPGAWDGDTTIWCTLGDQWMDVVDDFILASADEPIRLAQAAYYCTKAALASEV